MAATYVEGRDTDQGSGGPAQTRDLLRFLYSIDVAMSRTDNMTKKHPSVQDVTTIESTQLKSAPSDPADISDPAAIRPLLCSITVAKTCTCQMTCEHPCLYQWHPSRMTRCLNMLFLLSHRYGLVLRHHEMHFTGPCTLSQLDVVCPSTCDATA